MKFDEFVESITKRIELIYPDKDVVTFKINKKGKELTGISLVEKGVASDKDKQSLSQQVSKSNLTKQMIDDFSGDIKEIKLGTIIYLNDYFSENLTESEMEKIVHKISNGLNAKILPNINDFSDKLIKLTSFENARDNIFFELEIADISKANIEVVSRPFYDMRIVYKVRIEVPGARMDCCVSITKEIMESWGKTEEDLYKLALKNTPVIYPARVDNIGNWIKQHDKKNYDEMIKDSPVNDALYCITNNIRQDGAVAILYEDVLKNLCMQIGAESLFVFMGSVNEAIAFDSSKEVFGIPKTIKNYGETIVAFLFQMNTQHIVPSARLSCSLFKYDLKDDSFSRVVSLKSLAKVVGITLEDIEKNFII